MTNIGIVLPEDGFHEALRGADQRGTARCSHRRDAHAQRRPGRLHARVGARARHAHHRQGDRRRVPCGGARAVTAELAERMLGRAEADYEDTGGIGGTLAGNALSLAAIRATPRARADRRRLRAHDPAGRRGSPRTCRPRSRASGLPGTSPSWAAAPSTASSPRRRATARRPRPRSTRSSSATCTSTRSTAACCITPFHNMALMCPATTEADVERHTARSSPRPSRS